MVNFCLEVELAIMLTYLVYITSIVSFACTIILNGTYEAFVNFLFMSNLTDF